MTTSLETNLLKKILQTGVMRLDSPDDRNKLRAVDGLSPTHFDTWFLVIDERWEINEAEATYIKQTINELANVR